jgi:hypothetical protein
MNKILLTAILTIGVIGYAQAQTTSSTATQNSASQATAQGTIQFSQSPADQHLTETVRNVSAPVLGAYASSFSQFNCGQTTQGGFAVAGFSGVFGTSKDQKSCVLEVAAAETARQSTITPNAAEAQTLRDAATQMRCQINGQVYKAMLAAGVQCKVKPHAEDMERVDTQPESTRVE